MVISAPISLTAEAGTDVFDMLQMIFAAADKKGIKLPATSLDIIVQLWQRSPWLYKERALEQNVEFFFTKYGGVMVEARSERLHEHITQPEVLCHFIEFIS